VFYRSVPPDQPGRRECPACCGRVLPGNVTQWRAVLSPLGHCPACGTQIGSSPFSVELATALVLAAVVWRSSSAWQALALVWLGLAAIPLACIDLAVKRLPDTLTGTAFAGTMVLLSAAAVASRKPLLIAHVVLAAAALAALYLAITLIWPGGIGFGDVKLAASVGAALGWLGWRPVLDGTFWAFFLGAAFIIVTWVVRGKGNAKTIPFGPFMLMGAFVVIVA
jgi:leader peptidase (prepilin peptidase) / N-methyltransferase